MRRSVNRDKMNMDVDDPHDGYFLDFIGKRFYRKTRGGNARLYSNAEDIGTHTRSDAGLLVNSNGILVAGTANKIRYDYDPSTLQPRGALFELASTNICQQSQTFNSATWVKTNTTVNINAVTGPDNSSTPDQIVEAIGVLSFTLTQTISFTSGSVYCFSIWAKR